MRRHSKRYVRGSLNLCCFAALKLPFVNASLPGGEAILEVTSSSLRPGRACFPTQLLGVVHTEKAGVVATDKLTGDNDFFWLVLKTVSHAKR